MSNPFLSPSTLPYQLPPFAEISDDHFGPAIEQGMAEQRAEIVAITAQTEPATFANTMEPLERSGQLLTRVLRVFFNKSYRRRMRRRRETGAPTRRDRRAR